MIGFCYPNVTSDTKKFSIQRRNLQNYHAWDSVLLYRFTRHQWCYSKLSTRELFFTLQNMSLIENERLQVPQSLTEENGDTPFLWSFVNGLLNSLSGSAIDIPRLFSLPQKVLQTMQCPHGRRETCCAICHWQRLPLLSQTPQCDSSSGGGNITSHPRS